MTHSPHHDHDHDHNHEHDHAHDSTHHSHEPAQGMAFEEKLLKILDHWIKHNRDHADTYKDWAARAREANMPEVAGLLEEAADMNFTMNEVFEKARDKASKA